MNDEQMKLRGRYELLNDELKNLSAQIATEAKAISEWANLFLYCDRGMCEKILTETQYDAENSSLVINRISRLKEYHAQASEIARQLKELRPLVKK